MRPNKASERAGRNHSEKQRSFKYTPWNTREERYARAHSRSNCARGAGGTAAGKAAAPAGLAAVEAAVGAWCCALLRYAAALEEAEMAREQTSCTPAMQAAPF